MSTQTTKHARASVRDDFAAVLRSSSCALIATTLVTGMVRAQGLDRILNGDEADRMGFSLVGLGDMDGDGIPDYLVSKPGRESETEGHGGAQLRSGADDSVIFDVYGPHDSWFFGRHVAGGFDINGDGRSEFMISDSIPDNVHGFSGVVRVYSSIDASVLYEYPDPGGDWAFGAAIGGAGDTNDDGVDDFYIGAYDATQVVGPDTLRSIGTLTVYSGVDGSELGTVWGPHNFARFGRTVEAIGDYNADGHDDLAVTSSAADGTLYIVSGDDLSTLISFTGASYNTDLGSAFAALGDVDDDGVVDFAIGNLLYEHNGVFRTGTVRVISGADGATIYELFGAGISSEFGQSVHAIADYDGDGITDFAVGADRDDLIVSEAGAAFFYSGATGAPLAAFYGRFEDDHFGDIIADLGDITGDGRSDFAITAYFHYPGGGAPGRVYIYDGLGDDPILYCDAMTNSSGNSAQIGITGQRSVNDGDATLHVTNCPPETFGVFFYGFERDNLLFGAGRLCVGVGGSGIYRLGPPQRTDAAGFVERPLDFDAAPLSGGTGPIQPAQTGHFQFWFRDTGGFNLSNALIATFHH